MAKQVDNKNQTARGAEAKPKGEWDSLSLLPFPDCLKNYWNSEKPSKCPQRKRYGEVDEYRGRLSPTETRFTCTEAWRGKAWW